MSLTPAQQTALAAWVAANQAALGNNNGFPQIAAALNAATGTLIWRSDLTPALLNTAIVWSEWLLLTQAQRDAYAVLTNGATVDATNANIRTGFSTVLSGATQTLTNLTALAQRAATVFENLFVTGGVSTAFGIIVGPADVQAALGKA